MESAAFSIQVPKMGCPSPHRMQSGTWKICSDFNYAFATPSRSRTMSLMG